MTRLRNAAVGTLAIVIAVPVLCWLGARWIWDHRDG